MKRLAIIIGAPGKGNSRLKGVPHDISNLKNHLKSVAGGGWYEGEIIVMPDASIDEINRRCNGLKADFIFIYFSGHGSTNQYGERMAHLSNGEMFEDIQLLNFDTKRLIAVMDMCRVFVPAAIGSFTPLGEDTWSHFDGNAEQLQRSRKIFDSWIQKSEPGKLIIHSTSHLTAALDLGSGGLFTLALLNCASKDKSKDERISLRSIDSLMREASVKIKNLGYSQRPQIVYEEGNIQIPFAIGIPASKPRVIKVQPRPANNSGSAVFWGTLIGIGLLWALSEDEE